MPRTMLSVNQVAATLHVSSREVVRMAEKGILPGVQVRGMWQFRAGVLWNWMEANLHGLPKRRERDRHPETQGQLLLPGATHARAIAVDVVAKTRSSTLRKLVSLAEQADPMIDTAALLEALQAREAEGSTALQDGVAIPHPARPFYSEGPILAMMRTHQPIIFGERGGGLTDLFFLVCCPEQVEHLLYLGRLCRLLIDRNLQAALRSAESPDEFARLLIDAEADLCGEC